MLGTEILEIIISEIIVVRFIEILEIKQDTAQGLNFIRQLQYLSLIHI